MPLRDPHKGLVIIRRGVHGVPLADVLERLDAVIPDDAEVEIEEPRATAT